MSSTQPAESALETPRAAALAGIVFAVLFAVVLLTLHGLPVMDSTDEQIAEWFASGQDTVLLIGTLYLVPFASIAFLWFLAVVRDHVGEREDRFFGTVFYGSGLLFVALLFTVAGVLGSVVVSVRYLDQPAPTAETIDTIRAIGYTLLLTMASRAVAVFILATATIGLRFAVFPRWFAFAGYVIGLTLLLTVTFWDVVMFVVPAWVAFVSLFILRRGSPRVTDASASAKAGL